MQFTERVTLRFRDLDAYGHVNNATYLTLLETARWQFLERLLQEMGTERPTFVVARIEIDYRVPVEELYPLDITFSARSVKKSSFWLDYDVSGRDGVVHAQATTRMVCIDTRGRPAPMPAWFRSAISPGSAD